MTTDRRATMSRTLLSFNLTLLNEEIVSAENDTTLFFETVLDPTTTQNLRDLQAQLHCIDGSTDLRCEVGFRGAWRPAEFGQDASKTVVMVSFIGDGATVPLYAISPVIADREDLCRYLQFFLRVKKTSTSSAPLVSGRFSLQIRGTFFGA